MTTEMDNAMRNINGVIRSLSNDIVDFAHASMCLSRFNTVRNIIIDSIECITCEGDERETYMLHITSDIDRETWDSIMTLLAIDLDYGDENNE